MYPRSVSHVLLTHFYKSDEIIRYLEPSQLKVLYETLNKNSYQPNVYRLKAIVYLLHSTGARISEILGLNLEALDPINYKFQVLGKGNKQRWCFYNEESAEILEKYIKYYRHSEHIALFTAQHPKSKKVTRLSYRKVHTDWSKVRGEIAELKNTRLHDLRHTYATERVGIMEIEELRALMGHENIQTTLRYQKVTSSRAEEVARKAFKKLSKN